MPFLIVRQTTQLIGDFVRLKDAMVYVEIADDLEEDPAVQYVVLEVPSTEPAGEAAGDRRSNVG